MIFIFSLQVVAPRMACAVVDRAIQVHGGGGVSNDFPLACILSPIIIFFFLSNLYLSPISLYPYLLHFPPFPHHSLRFNGYVRRGENAAAG
jgi:hypothetical protein